MVNCNYGGLFTQDEIKRALLLVRKFKARREFLEREDTQDLLQRCLSHWYFKQEKFDPLRKVKRETFMSTVIENLLEDINKHNERLCRREDFLSVPFRSTDGDFDDDLEQELDMNDSSDVPVEDKNFREVINTDLKRLMANAKKRLSKRQLELCRLFQQEGLSMRSVSKKMNIPRATLFDEILRIREVFRQEGLKDYL